MSRYIPETLRILVANRANHCCEYCRLPADRSFFAFHIDHVVSLKHGGETIADNLAYACAICNVNKGSDVATFLADRGAAVRFYNPRTDKWHDHFTVEQSGSLDRQPTSAQPRSKYWTSTTPIRLSNDGN